MTDAVLAPAPARGGLTRRALGRLKRDPVGLAALGLLAAIALVCLAGPWFSPHAYDRVYRSYVLVPPSLQPYPEPATLEGALRSALARGRVELTRLTIDGDRFRADIAGAEPIDPRVLRYVERADEFRDARLAETRDGGRSAVIEGHVNRVRFLMGTDANGRDLLARILAGGRVSLAVGLLATLTSLVIGVAWGAVAGFVGGRTDDVMMRIVDVLYALPFVFLVILLVVTFGRNFALLFLAIGAIEWLDMARIVRGETLRLKRREFVQAARALGVSERRILLRHILPNMVGTVVVFATLTAPKVILLESFLSFLGLGVQAPLTSWGALIAQGAGSLQGAPHLLLFPAAFFVATLSALNVLGDRLRDAFDPRER
ncbi:ABC transporter permease [Methylopila turkensis]|uniref:Oligopeptide transport system permease protein OppC n=1 Tax=Methylopila turkensis TaxID=1437816 RepID=A0A9W6N608_9HYPH|nr:ABC transporter permease [Methylopila turkensis]GLK78821.1 peptide ABC transporter permease [Methylopila turkensis]